MTEHDRIRRDRALACDRTNRKSVEDAVRGLQSTDDPSLVPLHDELMKVLETFRPPAPHEYVPDPQAQGDCRVCGHIENSPLHRKAEGVLLDVTICPRCGGSHEAMLFNALVRRGKPSEPTHWGSCPQTREPVLALVNGTTFQL